MVAEFSFPFNYLCYFLSTAVLEPLFFQGMFFHLIWCSSIFSDILGNSLNWITGLHLTWVQLLSSGKLSSISWSTNAMCCGIWHHLHKTPMVECNLKVTLFHVCFSRFKNCTNGNKSRKTSQMNLHHNFRTNFTLHQGLTPAKLGSDSFVVWH